MVRNQEVSTKGIPAKFEKCHVFRHDLSTF